MDAIMWNGFLTQTQKNYFAKIKETATQHLAIFDDFPWSKVPIDMPAPWSPDVTDAWERARNELALGLGSAVVDGLREGSPAPARWGFQVRGQVCLKLK